MTALSVSFFVIKHDKAHEKMKWKKQGAFIVSIVPGFLLKKMYKKGSLRETAEGIAFDLKNILGPGIITSINSISINDNQYKASVIKILTSGVAIIAEHISEDNPILFKLNQEGTLLLEGAKGLNEGINKIFLDLISGEVGRIQVTLTDTL